ncbi:hypothetical protein ABPG74_007393 [Tetrahymena malaccensis]
MIITIDQSDPLFCIFSKLMEKQKYETYNDFQSKTKEQHLIEIANFKHPQKANYGFLTTQSKKKLISDIYRYVNGFENLREGKCFKEKWYEEYYLATDFMASYYIMKKFAHSLPNQAIKIIQDNKYQLSLYDLYTCIQKLLFGLQLRQICDIIYLHINKATDEVKKKKHEKFNDLLSEIAAFLQKYFDKLEQRKKELSDYDIKKYQQYIANLQSMQLTSIFTEQNCKDFLKKWFKILSGCAAFYLVYKQIRQK